MRHQFGLFILLIGILFGQSLAVKKYMFKECNQNTFCARNRHYAEQVSKSADGTWKSPYEIDLKSIAYLEGSDTLAGKLSGTIIKSVGGKSFQLPFHVSLLQTGGVRVTIDEKSREDGKVDFGDDLLNTKRYQVTDVIGNDAKYVASFSYSLEDDTLVIPFGNDNSVKIQASPVKFTFYKNGKEEIIINDKQFLNFEHWRSKPPAQEEGQQVLVDEKQLNEINEFESIEGFWQESFDGHTDIKKKGPESVGIDISFLGYDHVYGIPEHADKMSLRETKGGGLSHDVPYRLYNVDIFEYEHNSPMPMYGAIPLMVAHKPTGNAGIFWANAADTYVEIVKKDSNTNTHWISETGKIDFFVFLGDSPLEITQQYSHITGFPGLPNQFSIGYHQCRWNYNDQDDVLQVSENFDKHEVPYDSIWLDVEYTVHRKYFTWNEELFPDHVSMMHELDKAKRVLIPIIDPHIKAEDGYNLYEDVKSNEIAVLNNKHEPYHGHCWPGDSVWIEPSNPASQPVWDSYFAKGTYFAGDAPNVHIWNDMAEPSVFSGPESSMPKDNVHYGGWEHRDLHNVFGETFHRATYDSLIKRYDGKQRPFILTRAFYAGSQKTAAMWTGDNMAKWEYLKISIPMVLTQQIVGMPFAGADVGGFFGDPAPELLTRWYQTGLFYPFFRAHAELNTKRREPYLAPSPYKEHIFDAIRLRYKLLPIFYTAFYEATANAKPILQPTFYVAPENPKTYDIDDQFYLGESGLLVKPVTDESATSVNIYVPDDEIYYDYKTYKQVSTKSGFVEYDAPLDTIPMLMRGGHIHARRDINRRSSALMKHDPYTLVVSINKAGTAQGRLYVDDGESFDYQEGNYLYQQFNYWEGKLTSKPIHVPQGKAFYTEPLVTRIELVGLSPSSIGDTVTVHQEGTTSSVEVIKDDGKVVIRLPNVKIGGEWTIEV